MENDAKLSVKLFFSFFPFSQVVWCWDKWWKTSSMLVFLLVVVVVVAGNTVTLLVTVAHLQPLITITTCAC